jgi:prefoldin subunit 1
MAQISDGALSKVPDHFKSKTHNQVLAEIETQAVTSAQALQQVNGQITASERKKKLLELTQKELTSYPADTPVYIGVGKLYLPASIYVLEVDSRFMKEDLKVVTKDLDGQIAEHNDNVLTLKKKQLYLETTFKNAQTHIHEILGRR